MTVIILHWLCPNNIFTGFRRGRRENTIVAWKARVNGAKFQSKQTLMLSSRGKVAAAAFSGRSGQNRLVSQVPGDNLTAALGYSGRRRAAALHLQSKGSLQSATVEEITSEGYFLPESSP